MFYYTVLGLVLLGRTIFNPTDFRKPDFNRHIRNDYLVLEEQYNELALRTEEKKDKKTIQSLPGQEKKPRSKNTGSFLTPENLEILFEKYSQEYNIDKQLLKKIGQCESGFNPKAINGPYGGMYQYLATTWVSQRKAMDLAVDEILRFNAEEAIRTAAFQISRQGTGAWPTCSL